MFFKEVAVQSKFSIEENRILSDLQTDLIGEEVLYNLSTSNTALKNGHKSWRGAREKNPILVQMLVESFSKPGDVVLDCNASTGTFHNTMCSLIPSFLISLQSNICDSSCRSLYSCLSKKWTPSCGFGV